MEDNELINLAISTIKDKLFKKEFVLGLFVLGSTFKDEKRIDLFILIEHDKYIEEVISEITTIETTYPINPDIWALEAFKNSGKENTHQIFKEGRLIYWNAMLDVLASQVFKVKPYTIFSFELSEFNQKDKVRYNYQLYGKKNNGLLETWLGQRLGKSCFFVPYGNKYKVSRYFSKNGIKYNDKDMYL